MFDFAKLQNYEILGIIYLASKKVEVQIEGNLALYPCQVLLLLSMWN